MIKANKNTNPNSAFKTFIILAIASSLLNIHFLFWTQKVTETADYLESGNNTYIYYSNETLFYQAYCHAKPRSFYFEYLTVVFPW
jgi:hypothetical protein